MRRLLLGCWAGAAALGMSGCKDPETQAAEAKVQTTRDRVAEGRRLAAAGQYEQAIEAFKAAASSSPGDPLPILLLAEAHHEGGNDAAAILALKQAAELTKNAEPALKKQLADLYVAEGHEDQAIAILAGMRDANQLTDAEVHSLARLQARSGDVDGARKTLQDIQEARPDDVEAKVVFAELLLLSGEETRAAKLMDRLVAESPGLVSVRMLRALYFLNNGLGEKAEAELAALEGEDAARPDVVELKARVLIRLQRFDEAESALMQVLAVSPRDVQVMAHLAEVKLSLGEAAEAETLVDKALGLRPKFARALYVRGKALEVSGDLKGATNNYRQALASSPGFAPALSRMWRVYRQQGSRTEAISALERLFFGREAALEEKVALAELYLETRTHLDRARRLVEDVLRYEPDNERCQTLRARLPKPPVRKVSKEPEILRFGKR
jgi:tetratricopeptide (TPR) repeat protein